MQLGKLDCLKKSFAEMNKNKLFCDQVCPHILKSLPPFLLIPSSKVILQGKDRVSLTKNGSGVSPG